MSRFDRRASRPLIVVLVLAVSLGAFSLIHNRNKNAGEDHPIARATPPANSAALTPFLTREASHPLATLLKDPATRPDSSFAAQGASAQIASDPVRPITASPVIGSSAATMPSAGLIPAAKSKIDAGNLLEARSQLNDALLSGSLSDSDTTAVKALMSQINATVVFSKQRFADDPYGGSYVVKPGEALAKIAIAHDTTWELLSRINGIDAKHLRAGATIKVVQGPFFAVVDKKKFTMDLYLGGLPADKGAMYITSYPVGLGRDDSTPVGTWMVDPHRKLKHPTYYSPRGEGVIAADDPENPLGGYWIGLSGTDGQAVGKLSYGIHGTIDPDSIGKQSSMGCIRMRNDDVALVYEMMVEGKSMVLVKG